jgi:putative ABC transport system permease protein
VGLDWRVLGFTLLVSIGTGIIFGLVPALHSSKTELTESLKEGSRGSSEGGRRNRIRGILVVSELAIAVILLVGAGLLIQSLWRLQHVSPGFQSQNLLTFVVGIPEVKYPVEKQAQFYRDLTSRIQSLPGVRSASSVIPLPLSGDLFRISFETEGRPVAKGEEPSADFFAINDGYFKTLGVPIIKGRDFNERDGEKAPPVIIVNQSFAEKFFPGEDAVGKRIRPGISTSKLEPQMREIVGIVGDVRNRNLSSELRPGYFIPMAQIPFNQMTVIARTTNDPHTLITAVQNEVHSMDSQVPVFNIKTMDEHISATVAAPRFNTTLLAIFAAVALILTIVGLYGVMSYAVAQRTNEIGIRMALGARIANILGLVFKQAIVMVLIGEAIGLAGAFVLTRVISSLLFGVTPTDLTTYVAVALILGAVALLATLLPARRATKVDPLVALRYE